MRSRSRRSIAIGIAAIVVAIALVHGQVAGFDFVFDDHWTIEHNAALGGPLGPILAAVLGGRARQLGIPDATRPTMIVSMWLDRHLFGLGHPAGFHLHSLLLYVVLCVLAGWVVLLLVGRVRAAVVGALFFAVAPIHGEVVAAINYREDLLAALGVLVTLGALLAPTSAQVGVALATTVTIAFALALGAKESALALVPMLLAVVAVRRVDRGWARRREAPIIAASLSLVAYLNWRLTLGAEADDLPRAPLVSSLARVADTARFEVLAAARSLVPIAWSPDPARPPAASMWWIAAALTVIAAAVMFARRRSTRPIAIALLVAMTAPLIASPMFGPFNAYADRYLFLSVLGGAIFWGWAFATAARRAPRIAAAIVVVALGLLSWDARRASGAFRDDRTLWTTAVERDPSSPRAWVSLSRVHRRDGDLAGADAAVARALSLDARYPPARLALAYNHLARGDVVSARAVLDDLAPGADPSSLIGLRLARVCAAGSAAEAPACALGGAR